MTSLLTAISTRWPGVADDAFVLLDRDASNTHDPAVSVANELAALDVDGVIVVDDLHLAGPPPKTLTAFIEALPAGFRLLTGTRSDPALSLSRFRLRGELLELRGDDLRFAPTEMSDFFALHDVPLTDDELHRLHGLTEGWAAGAQLAAIALQRAGGRDQFFEAFATTDRAMGDFLVTEVLDNLPSEVVDFLVTTSVLETFDADLCAAVTGRDDAALLLDRLVTANLFVVPLDDSGRWYRYHHLFGAFLRARLAFNGQARVRAVHDRACTALEESGDLTGALHHAMTIGDVEHAGRIVRLAIDRSMSMSDGPDVTARAVRLWLQALGATFVETDPAWVVEMLIGLISLVGPEDAPHWLERVQAAHPNADGELKALIQGAWSEHYQHRAQPLAAIPHSYAALDAVGGSPPNRSLLPLAHTALVRAHLQAGQFDEARSTVGHALARTTGNPVADCVRNPAQAAYLAAADGELSRARDLAASAIETADRLGLAIWEPGRIFAGLALVDVHLERNEQELALRVLADVKKASVASHRLTLQSMVLLREAEVARVLGDGAASEALLAQTRLCFTDPDAGATRVFDEEAVAQALRFDPSKVPALLAALDHDRLPARMAQVRLALLERDAPGAAALLADLPAATTRRQRVERAVLRALSERENSVDQVNIHLQAAVEEGRPDWLIRSIIDQGPDVGELLASFTPDGSQERYVDALLAAAADHVVLASLKPETPEILVDPLSARELTVLRYLCSRLTYQEIASALYVSLNTLKSHVKSVYRKLDVASRAEAVDAGRRLGVI